ncbi:DMT family transporter [uncultured Bradyrhizobium sp.]|uniref:DMT family transporter n=1 Tax=uncultured Bradyrhizobium sp. TaxID=199684 RepID=UPI0035CC5FD6
MRNFVVSAVLAVGAGVSVLIQQVLNTNLRADLGSAAWSGLVSYALGIVCMLFLVAGLRDPIPSGAVIAGVRWWAWSGGLFGAIFIGLAIVLVPKLGGAAFIALLVAGQMMAALAFDHYGWLGIPRRPIDLPRVIGVALLVGGVVLIRR